MNNNISNNLNILWVDSNINSENNKGYLLSLKDLKINVFPFTNVEDSYKYMNKSSEDQHFFLIISGSLVETLLTKDNISDKFVSIFVFPQK